MNKLISYRNHVLGSNFGRRDYVGRAVVFDRHSEESIMIIKYSKRKEWRFPWEVSSRDDESFVEKRVDDGKKILGYHVYGYEIKNLWKKTEKNFDEAFLTDPQYSYVLPWLIFARGAVFGEKMERSELNRIFEELSLNVYKNEIVVRVLSRQGMRRLSPEETLGYVNEAIESGKKLVNSLYQDYFFVERRVTPKDKVESLLIGDLFEEFLPPGVYYLNERYVKLERSIYGASLRIGEYDLYITASDGGMTALAFIGLLLTYRPEAVSSTFCCYDKFVVGIIKFLEEKKTQMPNWMRESNIEPWKNYVLEVAKSVLKE